MSKRDADFLWKKLIDIFKKFNLRITVEPEFQRTDFLDIALNLKLEKYWPYRKNSNRPLYIHSQSNHLIILKQLPAMIEKRVSNISCNSDEFNKAKPLYEEALKNSGNQSALNFSPPRMPKPKNNRTRNIIWFNPPYSNHTKTNIGKQFTQLIIKHFPKNHKLNKVLNKNNIKISYSCMPNMKNIISGHNNKILAESQPVQEMPYNCRNKENCPLNGKCNISAIVYKANVKQTPLASSPTSTASNSTAIADTSNAKTYFGCCEPHFKARYNNHTHSFRNARKANSTELSKFYWNSINNGYQPHFE